MSEVVKNTWAISFIGEVSTVISSITMPRRGKAERGELALLKCHSLHSQTEVAGTVRGSLTQRAALLYYHSMGESLCFW